MDIVNIQSKMLKGRVVTPPSKSVAHRAIISAFLSKEACVIENIELSEDIKATLNCIRELGAKYTYSATKKILKIDKKTSNRASNKPLVLDCGESGSTLRFFIPIALLTGREVKFTGRGKLMQRPQTPYFDMFDKKGIKYSCDENSITINGKLTAGEFTVPGNISSQFITGLLFALPTLEKNSIIAVDGRLESRSYVDLTIDVLKTFGIKIKNNNYMTFEIEGNQKYKPMDYKVESDYSQAAFFLVAGAIGCDVACMNLRADSLQGDKAIIDIIKQTGARIIEDEGGKLVKAQRTAVMHGITVDVGEIPDLVPILAVLFTFCEGESRIINAGRLRIKESDRLKAIATELNRLGADIVEGGDYLKIRGVNSLVGDTVSSWNDHRIAMALAIAACRSESPVSITGARTAVTKSYPNFFEVYDDLMKN